MYGLIPFRRGSNINKRNIWDLSSIIDDFFNDSFFPAFFAPVNPIRADIRENENEYIVEAEIPGVNKKDIKLELNDDMLTISVERNEEEREERKDYIRRERRYGSFCRSFYVQNIRQEDVKAEYKDGVLRVTLPKLEKDTKKGRIIDIN